MSVYRRHNAQAKVLRAQRVAAELSAAHDDTTHHAAIAGRVRLTIAEAPMSESNETKPADPNEQAEKNNDPRARDAEAAEVAKVLAEQQRAEAAKAAKDPKPKGVVKDKDADDKGDKGDRDDTTAHGFKEPQHAHDKHKK
jgi:hypothetical protein